MANLTLRNAIPNGIRWEGMMCYVVSEGKSYVLTGGLTDSDWVEFGTLVNVNVVDNLASTSATDALSANQGRVLNETKLSDAPSDGSTYGRKDGAWEVVSGGGAVDSVFGRTGAVVAANGDYTFAQIGSTPTTLSGYGITDGVPTSRTLTAGDGLTGGGDLSANRTFTLGTPGSTTLSSTNAVTASSHTHAFAPGGTTAQYIRGDGSLATFPDLGGYVPTSRTITTGNHLSGGGALSADRTLTVTPTVATWISDSQSNNRMWFGNTASTTNGILFQASVNGQQLQYRDVSSDIKWRVNTSGNSVQSGTATATNFILSSDRRLKKNIKNYDPKPLNLKYRTWDWKKDGRPGKGFIAQEVQKTNPEYVVEGADGMLAVDYIGILIAKVAELESDIAKIKKQI